MFYPESFLCEQVLIFISVNRKSTDTSYKSRVTQKKERHICCFKISVLLHQEHVEVLPSISLTMSQTTLMFNSFIFIFSRLTGSRSASSPVTHSHLCGRKEKHPLWILKLNLFAEAESLHCRHQRAGLADIWMSDRLTVF